MIITIIVYYTIHLNFIINDGLMLAREWLPFDLSKLLSTHRATILDEHTFDKKVRICMYLATSSYTPLSVDAW